MFRSSARAAFAIMWMMASVAMAQQQPTMLQTPRQAVIEMFSGEPGLKKHLTMEVQNKLASSMKDANFMSTIAMARAAGMFQVFETGPVLLLIDNAQQGEKIEVRVDSDSLHGDMDNMELSFHAFRGEKEESLPIGFRVSLNLKQQSEIWRLNAVTLSARIPVGEARFYDPSIWNPALLAGSSRAIGYNPESTPEAPPKIPPARAMRLIGLAENAYAQKHPEAGFTCNLADLVNVGKGIDEGRTYTFLDPEFAGGIYNGYRYRLNGCADKPVAAYQVVAEPTAGSGKVFCSDATRTLRSSSNGNGTTCLTSGMLTNR